MEIKWIIVALILICVLVFFIFMLVQNQKDKKKVIDSMNEPEIEENPKPKDQEEN